MARIQCTLNNEMFIPRRPVLRGPPTRKSRAWRWLGNSAGHLVAPGLTWLPMSLLISSWLITPSNLPCLPTVSAFYSSFPITAFSLLLFSFCLFIDFREREKERQRRGEREIDLLFHLFMHSLVASSMCPHWGLNLQPCHIGLTL